MTILLNDIDIIGFSLIGLKVGNTYYREAAKAGTVISYSEGYQVTKAGSRVIVLDAVFVCDNYAALVSGIEQLQELLISEGTKTVEANNVFYEVFAKDGFKVSQVVVNSKATAKVEIPLTQTGAPVVNPEWILDGDTGEFVLDSEGRRILDLS
jgi:hypothetical protein